MCAVVRCLLPWNGVFRRRAFPSAFVQCISHACVVFCRCEGHAALLNAMFSAFAQYSTPSCVVFCGCAVYFTFTCCFLPLCDVFRRRALSSALLHCSAHSRVVFCRRAVYSALVRCLLSVCNIFCLCFFLFAVVQCIPPTCVSLFALCNVFRLRAVSCTVVRAEVHPMHQRSVAPWGGRGLERSCAIVGMPTQGGLIVQQPSRSASEEATSFT